MAMGSGSSVGTSDRDHRLARAVSSACEPLEVRRLFAASWTGTSASEYIEIVMQDPTHYNIRVGGVVVATLDTSRPREIWAGSGDDTIVIDSSVPASVDLILVGQSGSDTLIGGVGDDTLYGDNYGDSGSPTYNDSLTGNDGNDFLSGGRGSDTLEGGAGTDIANYMTASWATGGYVIDLVNNTAATGLTEVDSLASINTVYGSPYSDTITGSSADEYFYGHKNNDVIDAGDGNDTIDGFDGDDDLEGGLGDDSIRGGRGNDILSGSEGNDTLDGQEGNDTYGGDAGIDTAVFTNVSFIPNAPGIIVTLDDVANDSVHGYTDNIKADMDIIVGTYTADRLIGSIGNDTLIGAEGNDTLIGGDGDDLLDGGIHFDTVDYSDASNAGGVNISLDDVANDTANGFTDNVLSNVEAIIGSSGNDVLTGSASANSLFGGDGNDLIYGLGGVDTIVAGDGEDTVYGGDGGDAITVNDDDDADTVLYDVLDLLNLTTALDILL